MWPLLQQQNIYEKFEALNRVGGGSERDGYGAVTEFILLAALILLLLGLLYMFLTRLGQRRPQKLRRGVETGGPFEAWGGELAEGTSFHMFWDEGGRRHQTTGSILSTDKVGMKLRIAAEAGASGAIIAVKTGDTFAFHGVLLDGKDSDGLIEARPGRHAPVRLSGRSARLPVTFKAACALADRDDGIVARVTNISLGGVGMLLEDEVEGGTLMAVRMLVPGYDKQVTLQGKVEWCRSDSAGLHRAGFTITSLPDATAAWLADVMLRTFTAKVGGLS